MKDALTVTRCWTRYLTSPPDLNEKWLALVDASTAVAVRGVFAVLCRRLPRRGVRDATRRGIASSLYKTP